MPGSFCVSNQISGNVTGEGHSYDHGTAWSRGQRQVSLVIYNHTDKKENQIILIYKEIQSGAVAKS